MMMMMMMMIMMIMMMMMMMMMTTTMMMRTELSQIKKIIIPARSLHGTANGIVIN